MAELFAGTSGYSYPSWKPDFYPQKLAAKKFLEHYVTRLNAVEINYTFRRTPSESTIENWVNLSSEQFRFCIKAHQRITHLKRLNDVKQPTDFFLRSIDPLRVTGRLGVVLFQLPPNMKCDTERLETFLGHLPGDMRYAFEFRHESWFDATVYDLLRNHNVAVCLAESEKLETPEVLTANFVYFRLRKADYTPTDRQQISAKVSEMMQADKDVFLFFKHEDTPAGALYAEEMLNTPVAE
jgi:uncharacterized protein YecE (DUF72 family)